MALYKYGSSSKIASSQPKTTEFEILKASHKFLREDEDDTTTSWDDQVAQKYYSSLYREFAVCDLKHYKSGNFSLRWRTETEVLSGAGETTCGNTRCAHHNPNETQPPLTTLELPFVYEEKGDTKSALVKVVLCGKCVKKLMWKRQKEKEKEKEGRERGVEDGENDERGRKAKEIARERDKNKERMVDGHRRQRNSRSRSPRQRGSTTHALDRRRSTTRGSNEKSS